jgi:flagellum-specific ATP synthase
MSTGSPQPSGFSRGGYVRTYAGGVIVASGLERHAGVGTMCRIEVGDEGGGSHSEPRQMLAEVVGFGAAGVTLLPYAAPRGIWAGSRVALDYDVAVLRPDLSWRGRVLGPLGEAADSDEPLQPGPVPYPVQADPPPASRRGGVGPRLTLGVRALDLFTPCCEGQRMGIFAGSGVGKSSLMSMIARASDADVLVIGLIGERGRELNEFLERTLGPEGRARSIIVAATSDMPAMLRRRAAYVTLTIAEALRDQGLRVLCLMDSVTRFAMALREIYLAAGEVPTSRGYPPSVFAELPRLLERAGPGERRGSITGLFTVLVEGDDTNEPVSDAVRGILDGHIMLDRGIAESGRFPAVDIPRSLSRSAPGCYLPTERELAREARRLMRAYAEMADLVRLGAYKAGSNPELDAAIAARPAFERLLHQELDEAARPEDGFAELGHILGRLGRLPDRVTA